MKGNSSISYTTYKDHDDEFVMMFLLGVDWLDVQETLDMVPWNVDDDNFDSNDDNQLVLVDEMSHQYLILAAEKET